MDPVFEAGDELWNADRTAGYRFKTAVCRGALAHVNLLEPLGDAPVPADGEYIPEWLQEQLTEPD